MNEGCPSLDLGSLGFDSGAHVLVNLALGDRPVGAAVTVTGSHPELAADLVIWCRNQGHRVELSTGQPTSPGRAASLARWSGAERALGDDADGVAERPAASWGLAARGAMIEPGGPEPRFLLHRRAEVWTDRAAQLYEQAANAQWNAADIDWGATIGNEASVERAVVQVMTFLIENEEAALVVPARFLGQIHPHFREIQQILALIVADEARHIDVFTRRAAMLGQPLAMSTVGGRASLQTLLDEPDFAIASFLLSVMGEGTFVSLLSFLERHAPDPLTRQIAQLARNDEARHVAFGLAHLERHAAIEPDLRLRLARRGEARHHA